MGPVSLHIRYRPLRIGWCIAFDAFVDFDKTISDPAEPGLFRKMYDSGDNLHPNDLGHKAMGEAVDLAFFR